jgi:hypothetical protein
MLFCACQLRLTKKTVSNGVVVHPPREHKLPERMPQQSFKLLSLSREPHKVEGPSATAATRGCGHEREISNAGR